ncbi:hypothetical protein [Nocardia pseudobrasiliensis]|uniref:Uncharacterized protein n=1 Tax=Nocardia pseudobrasiliensis TaxID=45979 RepID=A0A370HLD4_9NOCA|nr:hypothetical protein [Nocardia pseudobrasiliensis]RDI58975.1 hypothetical protein DFR76_12210 [Nocardia pseudobrasiliensis]
MDIERASAFARPRLIVATGLLGATLTGLGLVVPASTGSAQSNDDSGQIQCTGGKGTFSIAKNSDGKFIARGEGEFPTGEDALCASANDAIQGETGPISIKKVENACVLTAKIVKASETTAAGAEETARDGTLTLTIPLDGKAAKVRGQGHISDASALDAGATVSGSGTVKGLTAKNIDKSCKKVPVVKKAEVSDISGTVKP